MIPCANPKAQYLAQRDEITRAVQKVLDGGWYINGEEVEAFEAEFAAYIGATHGIGVASGTDALRIALMSCGIGTGDEVITVSHTAVATVAAIEMTGATPVLVDIEPSSFTLDPARLSQAVTPKTKAVIPVHLYGQAAQLEPVLDICRLKRLRLIEDCAQAHGATYKGRRVGSWGDAACFSYYPTKNLGAIGDGGMVVTSDPGLAENARLLREYGWRDRYVSDFPGMNSRLDELQAAILRVKLRSLDASNAARRETAGYYTEGLGGLALSLPQTGMHNEHVYHLFVVRAQERDRLIAHLRKQGIGAGIHYPVPVHLQPAYKIIAPVRGGMEETERAALDIISLPMYPELERSEATAVVDSIKGFFEPSR